MPIDMPEVSIIIVSYNVKDHLLACLESIRSNCRDINHEIIVVDNNSNDGSAEVLKEAHPVVKLIANRVNLGFAKANNQGYEISIGKYILLLNPDTIVKGNAITLSLDFLKHNTNTGAVYCRLVRPDGSLQKSIVKGHTVINNILSALFITYFLSIEKRKTTYYKPKPFAIDHACAAFLMLNRNALDGGFIFDPNYFMYAEEPDLAIRIKKKGLKTYFLPTCEIVHIEGGSSGSKNVIQFIESHKSMVKFYYKHWSGLNLYLLFLSYWFMLFTSTLASLLLTFTAKGRKRLYLFSKVLICYPGLVVQCAPNAKKLLNLNSRQ